MVVRGERPVPTNSSFPESLNKSSLHNVNRTGRIHPHWGDTANLFQTDDLIRNSLCQPVNSTLQRGIGGAGRDRTDDILLAKQALSQLSYGPVFLSAYCICQRDSRVHHLPAATHRAKPARSPLDKLGSPSATFGRARAVPAFVRMRSAREREQMVGLRRLELLTPRLSSVCSNQLSYRPKL
jgi:hypothetical protein